MYRDCSVSQMYALKDGGDCLSMDVYPVAWRSQGMVTDNELVLFLMKMQHFIIPSSNTLATPKLKG